tara:strand:+ start:2006 stop:2230 length:225 start_codon:yes stop_codon:yes gene_type:complete
MIIGVIFDTAIGGTAAANGGSSAIVFYAMADAVIWADLMSIVKQTPVGALGAITVVVDTRTNLRRTWYNGQEIT